MSHAEQPPTRLRHLSPMKANARQGCTQRDRPPRDMEAYHTSMMYGLQGPREVNWTWSIYCEMHTCHILTNLLCQRACPWAPASAAFISEMRQLRFTSTPKSRRNIKFRLWAVNAIEIVEHSQPCNHTVILDYGNSCFL
jgi:hypothetical protein